MKEEILRRMELMKGKTFMYNTYFVRVTDYDYNEVRDVILLYTDRRAEPYDRTLDEAETFLDQFTPVADNAAMVKQETNSPTQGLIVFQGGLSEKLKDILLDNIEKVRDNKDYIPQAEVITQNVDSLINLAKVEVAYMATMTKMQKANSGEF